MEKRRLLGAGCDFVFLFQEIGIVLFGLCLVCIRATGLGLSS